MPGSFRSKIAMSTGYGDRKLPSMPRLLQERGYEADTFHVNDVGFWDRSKLYPALNFNHYFDKPFYKNDHFNSFGASDARRTQGPVAHRRRVAVAC